MLDESILREKAREAILRGRLPAKTPDRTTWVGSGSGAECAGCGEPVKSDEMGLEIEFKSPEPSKQYSLHTRCFLAWGFERAAAGQRSPRRSI